MGAIHTPPQPYLVSIQMEQLLEDYKCMKQDKHIIEVIAEFHLRFEGIHPFIDGNGITGRLILNLELIKVNLLPINIKFADRRKYYECFDIYYGEEHTSQILTQLIINYEIKELEKRIKIMSEKTKINYCGFVNDVRQTHSFEMENFTFYIDIYNCIMYYYVE